MWEVGMGMEMEMEVEMEVESIPWMAACRVPEYL